MKCFVCGSPIKQEYKETRFGYVHYGRPKTYCSNDCRDYLKYFNAFQKSLFKISLDDEHNRKIRGDLFRLANILRLSCSSNFGTKIPSAKKRKVK